MFQMTSGPTNPRERVLREAVEGGMSAMAKGAAITDEALAELGMVVSEQDDAIAEIGELISELMGGDE